MPKPEAVHKPAPTGLSEEEMRAMLAVEEVDETNQKHTS
jgi:hypothetical protein